MPVLHNRFWLSFEEDVFRAEIFLETTIQVTVVTYRQLSAEQEVAVWVTSMETGEPVSNATVFLFGGQQLVSIHPKKIHY